LNDNLIGYHFNDNNERKDTAKEAVFLDRAEIVRQQGPIKKIEKISAFENDRGARSTGRYARSSEPSDRLRFPPNLSTVKGLNVSRAAEGESKGEEEPLRRGSGRRIKKLVQSQVTSVDRLARSKWRRDPIHERLLFLTGHSQHFIDDPDYVKHLDGILKRKHNEKENQIMAALAEVERDREWLWSVKYDLDFSVMEKASLDQHRVERKEAEEAELNRQDAMFSSAGKQTFYTIATRTHGLDGMRNVKELRQKHKDNIKNNIRRGIANPRCTWLLHSMENADKKMKTFLKAETASDLYLESEGVIQDTATLQEQEEEQEEKDVTQSGKRTIKIEDDFD